MEANSNNKKPVLIVIAGPNGSGKTSVTSKILNHEWIENCVYINPDIVAQERFGDWNSKDAILQSVKYCEKWREQCLNDKQSLIFETVLSAQDKVDFILRALNSGFFVRIFFVCTETPIINASRIARRVMEGGHDVPISKVISRYQKSILNCKHIADKVDRLYLYDNSVENKEAKLLIRFYEGKIMKQYVSDLPEWAKHIVIPACF